jgi:putative chitinase
MAGVTPPLPIGLITGARVKLFASRALPSILDAFDYMQADLAAAGLTTPLRAQHFMAQVATETGGLAHLEENLNYSAQRLVHVWPNRFPNIAAAAPYAHNPEALANHVYGGRLGNVLPDDGWRYRGSGLMQVTGRANFRAIGHEDDPQVLRTAGPALKSALAFWTDRNLNAAADADDVKLVRKVVNGGSIGLGDARTWLAKARKIFV